MRNPAIAGRADLILYCHGAGGSHLRRGFRGVPVHPHLIEFLDWVYADETWGSPLRGLQGLLMLRSMARLQAVAS